MQRAVIGGTSIGSNIALEACLRDPDRFNGLLLAGPFLDNAAFATALGFSMMFALVTIGRPALGAAALATTALSSTPLAGLGRRFGIGPSLILDDPSRAAAFLQGLMFGRIGPPHEQRASIIAPALVIGFPVDPFHPLADATALTEELRLARIVRTASIADLRVRPERLAGEIARFIGDCRRRTQAPAQSEALA